MKNIEASSKNAEQAVVQPSQSVAAQQSDEVQTSQSAGKTKRVPCTCVCGLMQGHSSIVQEE